MQLTARLAAACVFGATLGGFVDANTLRRRDAIGLSLGSGLSSSDEVIWWPKRVGLIGETGPGGEDKEAVTTASIKLQTQMAEQMLLRAQADSKGLDDMVKEVRKLVQSLMDQIDKEHSSAQIALSKSAQAVAECGGAEVDFGRNDVGALSWPSSPPSQGDFEEVKKGHGQCLQDEAHQQGLVTECDNTVAAKQSEYDLACAKLTHVPADLIRCVFNNGIDQKALFFQQMAEYWSQKYNESLDLKQRCAGLEQGIDDFRASTCNPHRATLAAKLSECKQQDEKMKLAACAWKQALSHECRLYDECRTRKLSDYEALKSGIQQGVVARKVQWRLIKRLDCLIEAFNFKDKKVDKATLDGCAEAGPYDTDHLNINLPEVPEGHICVPTLPEEARSSLSSCIV